MYNVKNTHEFHKWVSFYHHHGYFQALYIGFKFGFFISLLVTEVR